MKIFDVLKNEKPVFVLDDIENKKTKALITVINEQMSSILDKLETFEEFAKSQLVGGYNEKIVMAKSLQRVYSSWNAVNDACAKLVKEEENAIKTFNSSKDQLINNLKVLLNDCQKFPVVSAYDAFNDDFAFAKKGHNVVILGKNNISIIETIIVELEALLYIEGNYSEVEPIELEVNYSSVEKNVEECKRVVDETFCGKPSKEEKLLNMIENMESAARDLVFFSTFKEDIKMIGCSNKDVDLFERELLKKYVPVKKQLSKLLKVDFIDICNISHNEDEFPTQEFKAFDE